MKILKPLLDRFSKTQDESDKNKREVYAEINRLCSNAGQSNLITFFRCIVKKIEEETDPEKIKKYITDLYFHIFKNGLFDAKEAINNFNTFGSSKTTLFVSQEVKKMHEKIANHMKEIYDIMKNEINSGNYSNFSLDEYKSLKKQIEILIESFDKEKEDIIKTMAEELEPSSLINYGLLILFILFIIKQGYGFFK